MNSFLIWAIVAIDRDGLLVVWDGSDWNRDISKAQEFTAKDGTASLEKFIAPGDMPDFLLPLAVIDTLRAELEDLQSVPF